MKPEIEARLIEAWERLPADLRSTPATADELAALERDLGPVPSGYAWFLSRLGGGPVGSEWLDDVTQVRDSHRKFESERGYWKLDGCFVIGWDGAGNPIAIDHKTGSVVTEDHDFGGIHELAASFEAFLATGMLKAT